MEGLLYILYMILFDLNCNDDDDDSITSNESFEHDDKDQKEFDDEIKSDEQRLATDETQDENFQDPIQQHNASDIKPNDNNASDFSSKEDDTPNSEVVNEENDNNNEDNDTTSNSGVDGENENNTLNSGMQDEYESVDKTDTSQGLDSVMLHTGRMELQQQTSSATYSVLLLLIVILKDYGLLLSIVSVGF